MENIIKKAIEGGYRLPPHIEEIDYSSHDVRNHCVLDLLFWQCLGKSCGWDDLCAHCGNPKSPHEYRHMYAPSEEKWKEIGTTFHEINLKEGWDKAVAFLENLVK